ncbi:unnamed protein product, partial [Polarella glacialis]
RMACYGLYGQGANQQCQVMLVEPSGAVGWLPANTAVWPQGAGSGFDFDPVSCCWQAQLPWQVQAAMMQQPMCVPAVMPQSDLQPALQPHCGPSQNVVAAWVQAQTGPGVMGTTTSLAVTSDPAIIAASCPTMTAPKDAAPPRSRGASWEEPAMPRGGSWDQPLSRGGSWEEDHGQEKRTRSEEDEEAAKWLAMTVGSRCSASALRRRRRQRAAIFTPPGDAQQNWAQEMESFSKDGPRLPTRRASNPTPLQGPLPAGPTRRGVTQDTAKTAAKAEEQRCARLTADLEAGGERMAAAAAALQGDVCRMSGESLGCRVVQLALSVLDRRLADELVGELHGHVREAINSPHGNYVIQKVVEVMPFNSADFVVQELRSQGAATARHRFGCRIICRLMEHSASEEDTAALADEVLEHAEELCRHSFGHHVVQSILEHGLPRQRACIAAALCHDLHRSARNRNASYVIEKALTYCSEEDRHAISTGLLSSPEDIALLAQNQFGAFVVRALLRLPGDSGQTALEHLKLGASQQRCQQQVGKHLHRLLEEHLPAAATAAAAAA